ncbi:hypothetical protein NHQ30_001436 [Ciborinia camelliae]|nr:hypothetical protein NHQ30_001436 [Ciborinia camelliae]
MVGVLACETPYPPYDQQVCDNCLAREHENRDCTVTTTRVCKSCGHKVCPKNKCPELGKKKISEITEEIADRFTPKARQAWLENYGPHSKRALMTKTQAESSTAAAEFDNRTEEERLQSSYDEEAQNMPEPASSPAWDSSTKINANFYKITLGGKAQICKYSICLDTIIPRGKTQAEAIVPTRPETKRYLITKLLEANQAGFETSNWATDYESFIVSDKPLNGHALDETGFSILTPHTRSGSGGNSIDMSSSLKYLGLVKIQALMDHVTSKDKPLDHPEEELKFLNIISWKKINSPEYAGGRVGKKFYPDSFVAADNAWISETRSDPSFGFNDNAVPLYQIRRGFFSSMRPGKGSVLLNINLAISAFFSPIKLSEWIRSNRNAEGGFRRALKGVRVVFDLHSEGRQKVFNIKSINSDSVSVSQTKFTKDGKEISVHSYMVASKFLAELLFVTSQVTDIDLAYPQGNFDVNALCINVGSNAKPTWYPADHLKIVEWQLVKKNLPDSYVAAMINAAKGPQASKVCIEETALIELGIDGKSSFYKVIKCPISCGK